MQQRVAACSTATQALDVLALIPSLPQTSPGSRFRIEQWAPRLQAEGVFVQIAPFEDEPLHAVIYARGQYLAKIRLMLRAMRRRLRLVRSVRGRFDVVFLFEEAARIGPPILERILHRSGVPIVSDFCDPIWLPYVSPRNSYLARLKFPGKTATVCALSREVLVGNKDLAEYARRHNAHVTIVPITIDTDVYVPREPETRPGPLVIGWSGSHSTLPHLRTVEGALIALARRRSFRLVILGAEQPQLLGVRSESLPWRLSSEVQDLRVFDIGIMPLPDDNWTRLRSQLKVRQYMGLGIPAVASPVGAVTEIVRDGENGLLARTQAEWIEKLERLLDDGKERERLGNAGRRTIESEYAVRLWAPRIATVLRRAAANRASGA